MPTLSRLAAVVFTLAMIGQTGCASRQTYAEFAQTGETYALAMDRLLLASAKLSIDASSWRMINSDALRNFDTKRYELESAVIEERLKIIGRLRTHARLVAEYFAQLRALATSDAPERVGKGLAGTAASINSLGNTLRREATAGSKPLITNPDIFGEIGQLAVSLAIQASLRAEFVARQELIRRELKTQEVLLARVSQIISDDLYDIREARIARLVINPLVKNGPLEKPEQWVETRREALVTTSAIATELGTASKAATALRESFEALVSGKLSATDLEALAKQVETIVVIIKTLESEGKGAR